MFKKNISFILSLSFSLCAVLLSAGFIKLNVDGTYKTDAQTLISYVEQVHPIFLQEEVPQAYFKAKDYYIHEASNTSNDQDFNLLTMQYLASLKDSLTNIDAPPSEVLSLYGRCIEQDDQLFVLDENDQPTQKKITQLGGKSMPEIFQEVDTYFPLENQYSSCYYHETMSFNKSFLEVIYI